MVNCSVTGCKSRSECKIDNITFHSFPKDQNVLEKWIKSTGRKNWVPGKNARLCSKHFYKNCFRKSKHNTYLKAGSAPTLHVHRFPSSKGCVTATEYSKTQHTLPKKKTLQVNPVSSTPAPGKVQDVDQRHDDDQAKGKRQKEKASRKADSTALELSCFMCDVELSEKIYKCVECEDVTMCGECDRDNFHPHHCVLRVPSRTIYNALRSVLASLQRELSEKLSVKGDEDEDPFQLGGAAAADDDEDSQHSDFDSDETLSCHGDDEIEMLDVIEPIAKPKTKEIQKPNATKTNKSNVQAINIVDSKAKAITAEHRKEKIGKRSTSDKTVSKTYKKIVLDTFETKYIEGKNKDFKERSELTTIVPLEPEIYVVGTELVEHDTGDPLIKDEIKEEPVDVETERIENADDGTGASSVSIIEYGSHHRLKK